MNSKIGSLKRIVLLIGGFLLCITTSMGQFGNSGYFNQANRLFNGKDYYAASQYYEKYLVIEKSPAPKAQPFAVEKKVNGISRAGNSRREAVYRLAECYRMCHEYTQAE